MRLERACYLRAARSKAHTPNWPTFAPPQWQVFTPPLTPDRKGIGAAFNDRLSAPATPSFPQNPPILLELFLYVEVVVHTRKGLEAILCCKFSNWNVRRLRTLVIQDLRPTQIGGAARSVINWRAVILSRWIIYRPAPMMMAMPVRVSALGKSRNTR